MDTSAPRTDRHERVPNLKLYNYLMAPSRSLKRYRRFDCINIRVAITIDATVVNDNQIPLLLSMAAVMLLLL
eukprot:3770755-Pleurochrysis_carterae.AAC.1